MKAVLALSVAATGAAVVLFSVGSANAAVTHSAMSSAPSASVPARALVEPTTSLSKATNQAVSALATPKGLSRILHPAWNPWRTACATVVTGAAFALGYWTLSRLEWIGAWMAGHFVSGGVIRTMLAWFSWGWVYNVAYNDVC